jgi:hypothetical protein
MSNDKQTAVDWLLDRIEDVDLTERLWENVKQQAKEMEKEQTIRFAYDFSDERIDKQDLINAYKETYGGNK